MSSWKPDLLKPYHGMLTGRTVAGLALTLVLSAPAWPASAHPLYDTDRIIQPQRQECVGAAGRPCTIIHSRLTRVGRNKAERMTLACPSAYPWVVGWDAKRHEHLEVTALPPPPDEITPSTSGKLHELSVIVLNKADAAGSVRFYVGCSTRPFDGKGGFMRQAQAFPSKLIRPQERSR